MPRIASCLVVAGIFSLDGVGIAEAQMKDRWQQGIPEQAFKLNEAAVQSAKKYEYDEAIQRFNAALKLKPDYIAAKFNMGLALDFRERGGDDTKAEQMFREAIETAEKQQSNDRVPLYNTLGWFLQLRDRVPEAKQLYEKALQLDPKNPKVLNNLGAAHERVGDRALAIAKYKEAAEAGSLKARENYNRLRETKP